MHGNKKTIKSSKAKRLFSVVSGWGSKVTLQDYMPQLKRRYFGRSMLYGKRQGQYCQYMKVFFQWDD
jgi:hypothetical protein